MKFSPKQKMLIAQTLILIGLIILFIVLYLVKEMNDYVRLDEINANRFWFEIGLQWIKPLCFLSGVSSLLGAFIRWRLLEVSRRF
jgi:hypothetical protein